MKVLFIYMDAFSFTPASKTLQEFSSADLKETSIENVQVAFIQAEAEDVGDRWPYVETKLVKNLKWVAKKNQTNKVVLHSFAHLSESKANPEETKSCFDRVQNRMVSAGFEAIQTPFGYFLDLSIAAPGHSLARVFKSF